jgi:hypothetical protein
MGARVPDSLGDVASRLCELKAAASQGLLSVVQVRLFVDRCANPSFFTYARISEHYNITRNETIRHAFVRTACGLFWAPGMDGGRDPYISPLDLAKFRNMIIERAADLNCITRHDALLLAHDLRVLRRRIAAMLLQSACLELPDKLFEIPPPCPEWLNGIAEELGLKICWSQELDAVRRCFCDHEAISFFFIRFQSVIEGRDPRLIFNMDETQLSARKRFRVLTSHGHLPLVKAEAKLPHITGVCTVSAGGTVFRPLLILKQLKSLKSLSMFTSLASFASSATEWITNELFVMFAIDFCGQVRLYRLSLPPDIADEPVLLILDGHISRANLTALMIFCLFNVDVLILPGHTTHVLQPLDVAVNSPLKTEFKNQLTQRTSAILEQLQERQATKADTLRCQMVSAFLNAFHAVTTPGTLCNAFETTGFTPFNPNRPHESLFVATAPAGVFEGVTRRPNGINAELLTDFDSLQRRFAIQTGRQMTEFDLAGMDIDSIWNALMSGTLESGRALTSRPQIWVMENQRQARVI